MSYNLVLPTSVEPVGGWSAFDRIVFRLNNPNQTLRRGTVRLNGFLQLWRTLSGTSVRVDETDKIMLNPNAGISGTIFNLTTKFGPNTVETINEYGKFVALKNEAKYYQMDNATRTDSMLELMTYSNDANTAGTDLKFRTLQGLQFPVDSGSSEVPFSLDLDICVNNSSEDIPFARTGEIELSILLQDISKSGILALGGLSDDKGPASYFYKIKNLEVRYITDMEQGNGQAGSVILEVKNNAHTPTIINKTSALEFAPTSAFDSVVCGFLNTTHNSTSNNLTYDYLASESIVEQIEYLEVKVNGRDDFLRYPLRFQTSEILYNYLLAWSPYILNNSDLTVKKHGLSYTKLSNTLSTGFGMGCHLYGGLDAGTRISFNLSLKSPLINNQYKCYFYTLGKLLL